MAKKMVKSLIRDLNRALNNLEKERVERFVLDQRLDQLLQENQAVRGFCLEHLKEISTLQARVRNLLAKNAKLEHSNYWLRQSHLPGKN
jgi:hypothetical protein